MTLPNLKKEQSPPFDYDKYSLSESQVEEALGYFDLNSSANIYTQQSLSNPQEKKQYVVQHIMIYAASLVDTRFQAIVTHFIGDQKIDSYLHLAEAITQKFLKRVQKIFPDFKWEMQTITDLVPTLKKASQHIESQTSDQAKKYQHDHVMQKIANGSFLNSPERDIENQEPVSFQTKLVHVLGQTHYGGPGSKYREINEDSFFVGRNPTRGFIFAGVIDGSGNSADGYLAGKSVNEALVDAFLKGFSLNEAFQNAEQHIHDHVKGGYATGACVTLDDNLFLTLGTKGDTKALIFEAQANNFYKGGLSLVQSFVAESILAGKLPPHAIHTSPKKNIITGSFGTQYTPHFFSQFAVQSGDQMVLVSDGIADIVSDFEILSLCQKYRGVDLEKKIFDLAFTRNNSETEFEIEFSRNDFCKMRPLNATQKRKLGDNLTVLVIDVI